MPIEKLRPSFTFTEDRLKELQAVVPEAFADGKINWDVLREALGEYLEEPDQEHFGLTWPGKREARRLASLLSKGTLVPQPGEGANEDTTHNIFIEGDNLEVLKLLLKSYAGRVKMIYIDPPYNTGNDFIYEDDYTEPLETYLKRTGQMDEFGHQLTTNTRASGRFHSKWLNMMYPRLLLARQLLREDGVIFVSIDDNEVHNLRQMTEEVFGDENFISDLVVVRAEGGGLAKQIVKGHDYVIVFCKNIDYFIPLRKAKDIRGKIVDIDGIPYWIEEDWLRKEFGKYGTCPYDEIEKYYDLAKKKEIDDGLACGKYVLIEKNGQTIVGRLRRINEDGSKFYSVLKHLNAQGVKDVNNLGLADYFQFPKPVSLVAELVLGATFFSRDKQDIVVDFFAGSCTTAHAVLQQNREDGGNRQFIMVQLPEPTPPGSAARQAGYATIAEIGKERIRRVIRKLQEEKTGQLPLPEGEQAAAPEDLGFRVFKLDRSHFVEWKSDVQDVSQLGLRFVQAESPLVANWEPQNLLTEILLLQGFPLDSQVILLDSIQSNQVQRVHSDACEHDLFVCLDAAIDPDTIPHLHLRDQDVFICLDSALTDQLKVQLADTCNLKVI